MKSKYIYNVGHGFLIHHIHLYRHSGTNDIILLFVEGAAFIKSKMQIKKIVFRQTSTTHQQQNKTTKNCQRERKQAKYGLGDGSRRFIMAHVHTRSDTMRNKCLSTSSSNRLPLLFKHIRLFYNKSLRRGGWRSRALNLCPNPIANKFTVEHRTGHCTKDLPSQSYQYLPSHYSCIKCINKCLIRFLRGAPSSLLPLSFPCAHCCVYDFLTPK